MFLDYRVKQQAQSKKESRLKDRRNNTDKSDQQNVQYRNYQLKNWSLKEKKKKTKKVTKGQENIGFNQNRFFKLSSWDSRSGTKSVIKIFKFNN